MALQQTQTNPSVVPAQAVQPCEVCNFEDTLTYVTAPDQLPAYVCTFCLKSWPKQYLN